MSPNDVHQALDELDLSEDGVFVAQRTRYIWIDEDNKRMGPIHAGIGEQSIIDDIAAEVGTLHRFGKALSDAKADSRLIGSSDDIEVLDAAGPGDGVEGPSMVIIQLSPGVMHRVHVTEEWLLSVLPTAPRQQIVQASLVIATDPNARLCQVIKNEAAVQSLLVMHTAALG